MKFLRSAFARMATFAILVVTICVNSRGDDLPELTEHDGPYMVLAYTFVDADAQACARAMAKELSREHNLPAFVSVSPKRDGTLTFQVLVGNCKTSREAFELLRRIRKIEPKCPINVTDNWRKSKGLSRAMTTTNPLVKLE